MELPSSLRCRVSMEGVLEEDVGQVVRAGYVLV
jgi:hypothetical protein